MQLTPNYRLMKPDGTDPVTVQDLNGNMDVLDAEVIKKLDKTGDASNVVNKFSQSGTRANLSAGEKLSISLGKIMKWFSDLKTVAFSGKYSDLTDRPTIPAGGIADASKIIDNIDDIAANTQAGYMAGALALKQVNSDLGGNHFGHTVDGRPGWKDGADTVHPFKSGEIAAENKINNSTAISIQLPDGITEGIIVVNVISTMNKTLEIQLDCESELLSSCITMPDENRVMNNSIFTIKAATSQTITAAFKNSYGNAYTSGSIFLLI